MKSQATERMPFFRSREYFDVDGLKESDVNYMTTNGKGKSSNGLHVTPSSPKKPKEVCGVPLRSWILLAVLAVTEFLTFASITVLSPFFPQEAEKKGATGLAFGAIIGIFELAALIISPFCIKAMRHASPRTMLLTGIALLGVGTLLFGLTLQLPSGAPFISICILLRVVQGFGAGLIDVCCYMMTSLQIPQRVSLAIGVLEMAVGLGVTAGPAVGGVLYDTGGYYVPFATVGCLTILMLPANFYIFPITEKPPAATRSNLYRFIKNIEVLTGIVSITSGGLTLGLLTGILEPHLRKYHLSTTNVGLITISTGAVFAVTTPIWGHIADKWNKPYALLISGCLLTIAGFVLLGPFPCIHIKAPLWMVLVSLVLCGLGAAAQSICPFSLLLNATRKLDIMDDVTSSGYVSATHITCSTAGNSLGPIIGGIFLDLLGFKEITVMLAVFGVIQIFLQIIAWYYTRTVSGRISQRL